ncbi:hypothetical protein CPC16_006206 [Podila verticillata]|nr:hypothetical protein CPC16_006206 [Podila verticillata]
MSILLSGTPCIAVSQGIMYALVQGSQSGYNGVLFVLIKSEYPTTTFAYNAWSVISTFPIPVGFFGPESVVSTNNLSCSVDKNGMFTYRNIEGTVGYRYSPTAPKKPNSRTCSSDSNGLGEWTRIVLVNPVEYQKLIPLIIQPEIESPGNNSGGYNEGDEMAIYNLGWSDQLPSAIRYARIDNNADITNITSSDISQTVLGDNTTYIHTLAYADGQMYAILVPNGDDAVSNTTLTYFPFEAPYNLTSPPTSAVSVPWDKSCGTQGKFHLAMATKGKFYYLCAVGEDRCGASQ